MQRNIPRRIEYEFKGKATAQDVVDTLRANIILTEQLRYFVTGFLPGWTVEEMNLRVEAIETGSLREYLTIAVYLSHQKDIDPAVPALIEKMTGIQLPHQYDAIVSISFLVILLAAAEFIQKYAVGTVEKKVLERQNDVLITKLAEVSGVPESTIRRNINEKFGKKKVLIEIGKAAVDFFRPSRNRNDERIIVDDFPLETEVVKAVPKYLNEKEMEASPEPKWMEGVHIEVRATDDDSDQRGWGGILRTVSAKRMPMHLYPGIDKDLLRREKFVIGDVMVNYRDTTAGLKPQSFDLVRIVGPVGGGDSEPPPLELPKSRRR